MSPPGRWSATKKRSTTTACGSGWNGCRNAVATTKAEQQKDSADIFGEAKPLLTDWLTEVTRDEIIAAFMALPSESQPAAGTRVNGIQYDLATAAQRNTWTTDNADRILYGASTANAVSGVHATALATVDATADKFTAANLSLLKRVAMGANPRIRPYKTRSGYEYFVCFAGLNTFRDLKMSLETSQQGCALARRHERSTAAPTIRCFKMGISSTTA